MTILTYYVLSKFRNFALWCFSEPSVINGPSQATILRIYAFLIEFGALFQQSSNKYCKFLYSHINENIGGMEANYWGVCSQESGVWTLESGRRSMESGSQESGVRSRESGIGNQESGIRWNAGDLAAPNDNSEGPPENLEMGVGTG